KTTFFSRGQGRVLKTQSHQTPHQFSYPLLIFSPHPTTSLEKEASWPEQQQPPPPWRPASRSGRSPRLRSRARLALGRR
uniref:Uncharacterized protein n=1 Tax=Aegilops tauschii subsp. strangulata TaxID=200361 RepID=A0A453RMT2_AEGTS